MTRTSNDLVDYVVNIYNNNTHVYCYGTFGKLLTDKLYEAKQAQYPQHYTKDRDPIYRRWIRDGKRAVDCVGLLKSFAWRDDAGNIDYASNGLPDCSANGMYSLAGTKGSIDCLPEIAGLGLWMDGHVGVYIGGGWAIEARGFYYGIVKTKVSDRGWAAWFKVPCVDYSDAQTAIRVLMRGCVGADVMHLQNALIKLGYKLPKYGADGEFGTETENAVKQLQSDAGFDAYGICGAYTRDYINNKLKEGT